MLILFLFVQFNAGNFENVSEIDLPYIVQSQESEPEKQSQDIYAKFFMDLIKIYQNTFSQAQGDVCNFVPSCSHFGYEVIARFGFVKGILLASDRLQRCHPFAWNYMNDYGIVEDSIRGTKLYDPPERYK